MGRKLTSDAGWKAVIQFGAVARTYLSAMSLPVSEQRGGLPVLDFLNAESFEDWLSQQPADAAGAWIKLAKKSAGAPGLTKPEAIDAALCHGWIDGQLDKYDDKYWLVRFTPRRARSKWSEVNKTRAIELVAEGRMRISGLSQIDAAKADGSWAAAYAPASSAKVPRDLHEALNANPKAAKFFATLKGANRYAILYRLGSVKRPETRARKIAEYVGMLERGETIHG
jgi:uncharacterized protein YdeI (YjbR/CyaY-like superfamily)